MKLSKAGQGERGNKPQHRIDQAKRQAENYPAGVSEELSPLFDFSTNPWMLYRSMIRQMIVVHNLIRHLNIHKEGRPVSILDAACGYGEVFTYLRTYRMARGTRIKYVGVDLDKDKIAIAKELRSTVDCRVWDVLDIGELPEAPFDAVVSSETLEHLPMHQGLKFLVEIYKVTKDGGIFILTCPTPGMSRRRQNPYHLREWEHDELKEVLEKIGWNIEDNFLTDVHSRHWAWNTPRIPNAILMPSFLSEEGGIGVGNVFCCKKV